MVASPLIWLVIGMAYLAFYMLVFEYALLVIAVEIAWALVLSLLWGVAKGVEALKTRL